MKVIDLLVDKVNGKQLPNKIKANGIVFILDKDNNEYKREDGNAEEFYTDYMIDGFVDLTDEVEILEEKKIPEKLDLTWQNAFDEQVQQDCIKMILENINIILDYLKSKGDE